MYHFKNEKKENKMEKESKAIQILKFVDVAAVLALVGFGYAVSTTLS